MVILPYSSNNPTRNFPYVTAALIALNSVIFFGGVTGDYSSIIERFAFVPAAPTALTIFTHQFLHGGFWHLFFNMWFLWIFGPNVEDLMGKIFFPIFYLACGVSAALLHMFASGFSDIPTIGASGAIFGVMGGYFTIFTKSKIKCAVLLFMVIPIWIFQVPAFVMIVIKFLMEIFFANAKLSLVQGGVAHWAHIGGFAFGAGILYLLTATRAVIVPNLEKVRRGEYAGISSQERFLGRLDAAYEKEGFKNIPGEYRELLKEEPKLIFNPENQLKIAKAIQLGGDVSLAVETYRRMLEAYPTHPLAQRSAIIIAKIFLENYRDPNSAAAYLQWVMQSSGGGPIASEAGGLLSRIRSGKALPPPPQE